MESPLKLFPNAEIRIPLSVLISAVLFLVSLSVGWGGYRAGFQNQAAEISQAKQQITNLHDDINSLRVEMSGLKQSVIDLKDVLKSK